ncbi:transmembrane protein 89 [Mustela lutreola]|uniref:transmembrane protein 89 n=1 Tax=Mustela lutreola TaxID=9666 RepID=UPI002797B5B4|nr:transmembrane protein 89 [Mustela lutreola]
MDPAGTHSSLLGEGEGCLPVARHPGSIRAFGAAMLLAPSFLLLLPLLAMPAPSQAWSRPLWYQVGLDLQPWGCQPNSLEGCGGSLGCAGHWMGLGMNRLYPVAGVTITTTMMLMMGRAVLQRRRTQATKSEHPKVTTSPSGPWKRRTPISDRALLLGVLHMLDSLLVHIEGHLQRISTQQKTPIKAISAQSG